MLNIKDIAKDNLYTMQETAEILNVTVLTIKNYIKQKKIQSNKIGGKQYIKGSEIIAFCESKN